jgi:hypothetical protein
MIDAPHFRGLREIFSPLRLCLAELGFGVALLQSGPKRLAKKRSRRDIVIITIIIHLIFPFSVILYPTLSHSHTHWLTLSLTHTGSLCHSHTPTHLHPLGTFLDSGHADSTRPTSNTNYDMLRMQPRYAASWKLVSQRKSPPNIPRS